MNRYSLLLFVLVAAMFSCKKQKLSNVPLTLDAAHLGDDNLWFTYNIDGYLTKAVRNSKGWPVTTTYSYTDRLLAGSTTTSTSAPDNYKRSFIYDTLKQLTEVIQTYEKGVTNFSFQYNSQKQVSRIDILSTATPGTERHVYEYMGENLVREDVFHFDGNDTSYSVTYEYSDYDSHPSYTLLLKGVALPEVCNYELPIFQKHNPGTVKVTHYEDGKITKPMTSSYTCTYQYNDKGYPVSKSVDGAVYSFTYSN